MSFTSQPTPGYVRSSTPTRVLSAFLEACQQGLTMSHSLRVRGSKPFLQASSALDKKPTQSIAIDATATCTHRHFPPSSLTSQVWLALYCPPRKLQTTPLRLSDLTFLLGMEGLLTDSETQSSDFIWGGGWINSYSRHATIFLFLRNYGFPFQIQTPSASTGITNLGKVNRIVTFAFSSLVWPTSLATELPINPIELTDLLNASVWKAKDY